RVMLLLRQTGQMQKLAKRRLADKVGLLQQIAGAVRLQRLDDRGDRLLELRLDQFLRDRALQGLRLRAGRKGKDERRDPLHKWVDQPKAVGGVEQRGGKGRRDVLAQEG